jgi:hypothetical protein
MPDAYEQDRQNRRRLCPACGGDTINGAHCRACVDAGRRALQLSFR